MIANSFVITDRQRKIPIGLADIKDFVLRENGQVAAESILENPYITLYALDLEHSQAVFIETAPDVNLSQAPFYYLAQFENAVRVLTVPFATMIQLAQSVMVDDERLILIHSVGRAGSTLVSQILAQVEGVINISEPDALTWLVFARYFQPDNQKGLAALLDATIRLLCKTPAQTAWVIKGRSFVIELADLLHEMYPQIRNLFLYRDAETWLQSSLSAYDDGVERTDEEQWAMENKTREILKAGVPLLAQHDPNKHLSMVGILTLMWLSVMEQCVKLQEKGVEMLAIYYANWSLAPHETAVTMLDYCGCHPTNLTAIENVLKRDSQAGTSLSRQAILHKQKVTRLNDLDELNWHLQNHTFIKTADFEVANTLKL